MRVSPTNISGQPDNDGLTRAAAAFFPNAEQSTLVADRAHLLHVHTETGAWCVRRWPNGTSRERIAFVHALLSAAHEAHLDFVPTFATAPTGESILLIDGDLYDAQSWLLGR